MIATVRLTPLNRPREEEREGGSVAVVHFSDDGRPPSTKVNHQEINVKVGDGPEAAACLRQLAGQALAAAEVLDPQWAGLTFQVRMKPEDVFARNGLDALNLAVDRHRGGAEPVSVSILEGSGPFLPGPVAA